MELIKEYCLKEKQKIKEKVEKLKKKPALAIIELNDDAASKTYVKGKLSDCEEVGIVAFLYHLATCITQEDLLDLIEVLNENPEINGIIVQLPLPKSIDYQKIKLSIDPIKDVDGFHPLSLYDAATPKGIIRYLDDQSYSYNGKNALIIGRSDLVGKPMAHLLLDKNMNVTVVHSKTSSIDLRFYIEYADLIIVAVGKAHLVDNEYKFKKDCIIFDVGINIDPLTHKLIGDCDKNLNVSFQSPVPGGVGLLTRLSLIKNVMEAYNNEI